MIELIKDWIGTGLLWLVLLIGLCIGPLAGFARGMATVPQNVPPCRICTATSLLAIAVICLIIWGPA